MNFGLRYLLVCLTFFLVACGGGTSGTGSTGTFSVNGTLRTIDSMPLAGVQVLASTNQPTALRTKSLIDTKASAMTVTDEQGNFGLVLSEKAESVSLEFQTDLFQSSYQIVNIPGSAAEVKLGLIIDSETYEINEESELFEDDEGNELD